MSTVVAVYTGQGLASLVQSAFADILPGCRLVNLIDDSLIADVIRAGQVTPAVTRRLLHYYEIATDIGADVILNTCSSVGEVVELGRRLIETPIVRIDEPMADEAVRQYARVGVLATLPTTLQPTLRLLASRAAAQGKQVTLVDGLAAGAYQSLVGGQPEEHDRLLLDAALRVADQVEALVLAQGSMARMEKALAERTGRPVLSSPRRGVMAVQAVLNSL
jgi:Asp/Glu/hydantoin racemase